MTITTRTARNDPAATWIRPPPDAVVIGAGPAGLMAAEILAGAGARVLLAEAMPSPGRKLLMAGKSGLNLTSDLPEAAFLSAYGAQGSVWLAPTLADFGPDAVQNWARGLGQPVFAGSSGRVFPVAMKASPLLRAWLARLVGAGVQLRTRWRWTGWADGDAPANAPGPTGRHGDGGLPDPAGGCESADGSSPPLHFDTPDGPVVVRARVTVLALGGASWARLGSDGAWAGLLAARGVALAEFQPDNAALSVMWSPPMARWFGHPVKPVALRAGGPWLRGECVISERGLEGGAVYASGRGLRAGAGLEIDLLPDLDLEVVAARLSGGRAGDSRSNRLRKALRLSGPRLALLQEFGRPLSDDPNALARLVKSVPVRHAGPRPIDEAISTSGGVRREALTADFELHALPGVYCAGEMLDWDAPTGGYLLTACLATGRAAGQAAATRLQARTPGGWLNGQP